MDRAKFKQVEKVLKHRLRESKEANRKNLEVKLGRHMAKDVWSGMREITSFKRKVEEEQ